MKPISRSNALAISLFKRCLVCTVILISCFTQSASAQQGYAIKGNLADTALRTKMFNSTVYVLNAKDSILTKFIYAAADGGFSINNLPAGNYILMATYPDYADYVEPFSLDAAHAGLDFGTISMQLKSRLLNEVIIKGGVTAIKIKGDTTEFKARAYVIQPNDKVEDLLKQLPGIQVDKDGKITANGERVNKVLLDGEEFFGDDPTLVTKNIRADMVDKIQLYDKKSDQATFTGIDDGVKTKTINVKLRADKNNGMFGKVDAGIGSQNFYQAQGLYNHFKPGEKYAAYATAANNGKINLGQGDNSRLGSGGNNVQVGDVVIVPATLADEQDGAYGTYNGRGLPVARTGGLHYDGKWNNNKEIINTNYKAGYLATNGVTNTSTEQHLPTGDQNNNTSRNFDNSAFRQKLDAAFQANPDSASGIKVMVDGTLKNATTRSNYLSTTTNGSSNLLNSNVQSNNNTGNTGIFNAGVLYTHRMRRPGRTFSWNVNEAYNRNQSNGYQNSVIDFYNTTGGKDSTRRIDQYKTTDVTSSLLSSNATYTEPLSKVLALIFNYGLGMNNSSADRQTFDASMPGNYNLLNTTFSNNYRFNQFTNQAGAVFNYHQNKTILTFGSKVSQVDFKQVNLNSNDIYRRDFINLAPQVNYQYKASQQASFSMSYNGNTIQPTIDQVQPVRINNDPLNIVLGNPDLKASFSNNFKFNYRLYRSISNHGVSVGGGYNLVSNAVVNNITTDATGKTITQYLNLQGQTPFRYNLNTNYYMMIAPINTSMSLEFNTTGNISYNYINNVLNKSEAYSYGWVAEFHKSKANAHYFQFVFAPNYTVNKISLQQRGNNNAWGIYSDAVASVYLPAKLQVSTDYNYNYTAATASFTAQSRMIWNASISKAFFKDNGLKLAATVNDLLNQNANYSRFITANSITQSNTTGIRRYLMFSLTWDFNKIGASPQKK
ncbi:outer membrane beta-barrel protein [Mucilaginibacter mali]|uniref:Outer membrane beta-barrel protein n=1 Tax=Mucilaginibacter mali TaxID=2740462 RepID=A0A7D4TZH7_9SPHI|nr:outer membrane beta-barrel family protein [Mucilaginibacter mali]QKJ32237.1 outer membrane beta-barrel protein [Mucilaginibacter mali]